MAAFRPAIMMQRVSEYVEANGGMSGRAIIAAVKGKAEHKRLALELLIREGYIVAERSGSANLHTSARPYREAAESRADDA